jgi:hypothetical protein
VPPGGALAARVAAIVRVAAVAGVPAASEPVVRWPFCADCRADRALRRTAGAALCLAALLPVASLLLTAPISGAGRALVTAAVAAALAVGLIVGGLGLLAAASWPVLSGAHVSEDGEWVLVDANPGFWVPGIQLADARPGAGPDQRLATSVRFSSTLD